QLLTLRVRAIAGEIGAVADKARHVISGWGLKVGVAPRGAGSGADIEHEVAEAGLGLHPDVAQHLGRRAQEIFDEFGSGPESVQKARHVISGWGARAGGSGVLDTPVRSELIEISHDPGLAGWALTTFVEVAVLAQRPLPEGI